MGAVTAVSRALGFVRVLVVAAVLGTTYLGNAFQAANSISNVLFELLAAGALSAVLVPAFVSLLDAGDRPGAEQVAGGVLGVALAGLGAVVAVGVLAAPWLAQLLTIGVPAAVAEDQQELVTFLLRFFLPQVLLYAAGTVATAVLYATRHFAVTAAAPIGNTVVMVAALLAFRAVAGPDPGVDLSATERWLLVLAGTGGVVAFVGVLLAACRATGFRLRPRRPRGDRRVLDALGHSAWGAVLHTGGGALLGAAIVAGAGVEGAVVAYQVGWVFFLAPYGVLAQPIHTAILPELVGEVAEPNRFAASVRWALERIAILVLPASAAMVALAGPAMRVVSFGETGAGGAELLAAALAGLAVGLLPYSAFLLLARASYALGDSRTPGLVSLGSAAVGVAVMLASLAFDGAARVAVLGLGHSAAYLVGALVLGRIVRGRLHRPLWPGSVARIALPSLGAGLVAWLVSGAVDGQDRAADLVACLAGGAAGAAVLLAGFRLLGLPGALGGRLPGPDPEPGAAALEVESL
jgi:putative peptidoglycan lipid II flippase